MSNYLRIPNEISLADIRVTGYALSSGMYKRVIIPNRKVKRVSDLLNASRPFDKGNEPGSLWYMRQSTHYFIRTKALQEHSCLLYPKGEAIVPVNPRVFESPDLSDTDILMSKDSNVGECVMVDGGGWKQHMFSGGVVRLHPVCDRFYFFAFLKHPLFKTQLLAMLPRGATITHAKTLWMDCLIPFPDQPDADRVIRYVSALMNAIVEKEKAIRERHSAILKGIDNELSEQQDGTPFQYEYPTLDEIRATTRLDTGVYCRGFRHFKHRVDTYKGGSTCLSQLGLKSRRGTNLAVSVIGKSLYSEQPKPDWYQLIRPVNIGEFGTLVRREWLGTKRTLNTVNQGELIIGCEGFEKGRSMVLIDGIERCVTNFHGTVLYWNGSELWQVIFMRCVLAFLRDHGVIDWVGVGGSGGHMSPEYFDYLPIPKFPEDKQAEIARLYHNPAPTPSPAPTLATFVEWHRQWNTELGIWELDREMKNLRQTLADVQEKIINGETVIVPLADAPASSGTGSLFAEQVVEI